MKVFRWTAIAMLIGTVAALGYGVQPGVRAQEDVRKEDRPRAGEERSRPGGQMTMCPMMAGLKGVELHADSPALLTARADELNLTDEQARELRQIAERAREQAREVLNEEQREELAEAPEGPLSPMQIARMRIKARTGDQEQGQMCPMCLRMMRERMKGQDRPEPQ